MSKVQPTVLEMNFGAPKTESFCWLFNSRPFLDPQPFGSLTIGPWSMTLTMDAAIFNFLDRGPILTVNENHLFHQIQVKVKKVLYGLPFRYSSTLDLQCTG